MAMGCAMPSNSDTVAASLVLGVGAVHAVLAVSNISEHGGIRSRRLSCCGAWVNGGLDEVLSCRAAVMPSAFKKTRAQGEPAEGVGAQTRKEQVVQCTVPNSRQRCAVPRFRAQSAFRGKVCLGQGARCCAVNVRGSVYSGRATIRRDDPFVCQCMC